CPDDRSAPAARRPSRARGSYRSTSCGCLCSSSSRSRRHPLTADAARAHRTQASAQIAPLVLDLRLLLRVVLLQALGLLARHARHELAFLVDLEPRDRQRDGALTDAEKAADVDQRMHLAVLTRLRDAGDLADLLAFARIQA